MAKLTLNDCYFAIDVLKTPLGNWENDAIDPAVLKERCKIQAACSELKNLSFTESIRKASAEWLMGFVLRVFLNEKPLFLDLHEITEHINTAKTIAEKCFPSRKALCTFTEKDQYVIEVTTEQDINDFLNEYNHCINLWIEKIPPEALALILLTYNIKEKTE